MKVDNMEYIITYANDFSEKYYYNSNDKLSRHINTDQWIVNDKDTCIQVVKDFLDVPAKSLTNKQIKNDFGIINCDQLNIIKSYYNGRLKIYKKFLKDMESDKKLILSYDIPEECNSFSIDEDFKSKQNMSNLKIEKII